MEKSLANLIAPHSSRPAPELETPARPHPGWPSGSPLVRGPRTIPIRLEVSRDCMIIPINCCIDPRMKGHTIQYKNSALELQLTLIECPWMEGLPITGEHRSELRKVQWHGTLMADGTWESLLLCIWKAPLSHLPQNHIATDKRFRRLGPDIISVF